MYSKLWTATVLALALVLKANAHAAVSPVLGLGNKTPVRADVKQPSAANPCGAGVKIASEIDSSTVVVADAEGSFNAVITNYELGLDGSRQVKAALDSTGTGKYFKAISVTTNGVLKPTDYSSQSIVAVLPPGTICKGGATKDKCLVQYKNAYGFGNCVVVSQYGSAYGTSAVAAPPNYTGAATTALESSVAPPYGVATSVPPYYSAPPDAASSAASVAPPYYGAPPAVTSSVASVAPPYYGAASAGSAYGASVAAPYNGVSTDADYAASTAAPYNSVATAGSGYAASAAAPYNGASIAGSGYIASVAAPYNGAATGYVASAAASTTSASVASYSTASASYEASSAASYAVAPSATVGAKNYSGASVVGKYEASKARYGKGSNKVYRRGGTSAARAVRVEVEGAL